MKLDDPRRLYATLVPLDDDHMLDADPWAVKCECGFYALSTTFHGARQMACKHDDAHRAGTFNTPSQPGLF